MSDNSQTKKATPATKKKPVMPKIDAEKDAALAQALLGLFRPERY